MVADVCSREDTERVFTAELQEFAVWIFFPRPECAPMDQAYACLYLASRMGRHVKGQVILCSGSGKSECI